jgi:hypothetical protein
VPPGDVGRRESRRSGHGQRNGCRRRLEHVPIPFRSWFRATATRRR